MNQTVDSILIPLLQTRDEAESQRVLDHLIADHILPVSKEIIYHKLRAYTDGQHQQDSEDVQNTVVLKLLSTLRDYQHNPDLRSIGNFPSYVAVTTYNACNEYLRQNIRNAIMKFQKPMPKVCKRKSPNCKPPLRSRNRKPSRSMTTR